MFATQAAADGESRIELRECQISSSSGSGVGVEGGDVTLSSCRIADCKNHGALFVGPTARGAMCNVWRQKSSQPPPHTKRDAAALRA